jgi:hypothetical protein
MTGVIKNKTCVILVTMGCKSRNRKPRIPNSVPIQSPFMRSKIIAGKTKSNVAPGHMLKIAATTI